MRLGLAVFFTMNVMVFTMVLWSWDAYSISASPNASVFKDLMRLACLAFATPVVLILGKPLMETVVSQLQRRVFTADGLLVVGVVAAYLYSVVSIATSGEHIYFEVACMILVAVTLGRWLEAEGKQRAMRSLETLQDLLPDFAHVVEAGNLIETPLGQVKAQQIIRVLPGERIPLDGMVVGGESFVDERIVTGESQSRHACISDRVYSGAVSLDGVLDIEVAAVADESVIQRLVRSVREAAQQRSRPERLADRLASVLAVAITLIAVAVFGFHHLHSGLQHAMMAAMSVVLIACPCALAVATPLAIWTALSQAAERGIIFRTSDDLLRLSQVDHVCFDKTGTLTTGMPMLESYVIVSEDDMAEFFSDGSTTVASVGVESSAFVLSAARALAKNTSHPLATAMLQHLSDLPDVNGDDSDVRIEDIQIADVRTSPGRGVTAVTKSSGAAMATSLPLALGSERLCREMQMQFPRRIRHVLNRASAEGLSVVLVGCGEIVRGCFVFCESLRAESRSAIASVQSLDVPVSILTGDRKNRGAAIADELGVEVHAELLPNEKCQVIETLRNEMRQVAMVGDGLNDAPALGLADVGIAMGCGVELSRDVAEVCLLSSDVRLVPWAVELARMTRKTINRNLFWALAYNTIGIGLAATGKLNPILAAAAMVLSSVLVISESLKLQVAAKALSSSCPSPNRDVDVATTELPGTCAAL